MEVRKTVNLMWSDLKVQEETSDVQAFLLKQGFLHSTLKFL